MAEPPVTFAALLRQLRTERQLTQEELAEASGVRPRTLSDLERGVAVTPQRETIRRLADALQLAGQVRAQFEAVARGRTLPAAPGAADAGSAAAATRTLPRDIASFTGRLQELQELLDATRPREVVSIHAIGGMAGVGKTAFAVHAAHRLADRFPGGQVFLALHGHTPGQAPLDPVDALASLLLTAGVPAGEIPAGLEARMALWRDRIAAKQLLLVLDDAASSEQVRPLLPGAGGSLVLVTSRRHLSALEDAATISLDTLPPDEAASLLVRLAGRPGLSPDDPAVGEITGLCGYLPLAIGMVARQLHHHPTWTAAGRAAELAAARDRLELMATENLTVAAAFDLSYADLTADQQRLFRRLGLHPGQDVDGYATAALDDTDLGAARRGLEALYDQYLLTEPAQGRYRMHDLIREHARALADRLDQDQDQATARLLDYYQYTAARADALIIRLARPRPDPLAGEVPAAVPDLADREQALAWARAERASLLACLDQAARTGQHARVIALTAGLTGLLRYDGPYTDAIARNAAAVQSAHQLGDRPGQAGALVDLGVAHRLMGDYPAAAQALTQALDISRELGDRLGEARALTDLGDVRRLSSDYPAAAQAQEQALVIYRDLGDRLGQARALIELGDVRRMTSDYPAAAQAQEQALVIYRDLGHQQGQANALSCLGDVWRATGEYLAAAEVLEQAQVIYRDLGDRLGQANALNDLGDVRRATGDYPAAALAQEQALVIFREIGSRLGQAIALNDLGDVRRLTGEYPAASQVLEQALSIFRELGDRIGEAIALTLLGDVRRLTGEYLAASQVLEQALGICRDLGNRQGEADAFSCLGDVRRATGEYPAAAEVLEQALSIYRDLGDRDGEAEALNYRGTLHRVSGDLAHAEGCHKQALELAREIGSSSLEAHALAGLGRCAMAAGHVTQAGTLLRQALEICQRIGAAAAPGLLAELDTLASPPPESGQCR